MVSSNSPEVAACSQHMRSYFASVTRRKAWYGQCISKIRYTNTETLNLKQ